jgi:hypothetical protein
LNNGNQPNLDIGGSVTCSVGGNIFLHGAKEAAQKVRRRRRSRGSAMVFDVGRRRLIDKPPMSLPIYLKDTNRRAARRARPNNIGPLCLLPQCSDSVAIGGKADIPGAHSKRRF